MRRFFVGRVFPICISLLGFCGSGFAQCKHVSLSNGLIDVVGAPADCLREWSSKLQRLEEDSGNYVLSGRAGGFFGSSCTGLVSIQVRHDTAILVGWTVAEPVSAALDTAFERAVASEEAKFGKPNRDESDAREHVMFWNSDAIEVAVTELKQGHTGLIYAAKRR